MCLREGCRVKHIDDVVVEDSERTQTSIGNGTDVAVWSGTEGLYGDFAASVSDIFWDQDANNAYYGRPVTDLAAQDRMKCPSRSYS